MAKKYHVRLSTDERAYLTDFIGAGKAAARTQAHTRVLLKADDGPDGPAWSDDQIAAAPDSPTHAIILTMHHPNA